MGKVVGGIFGVAVMGILFWLWGPQFWKGILVNNRTLDFFFLILVVGIIIVTVVSFIAHDEDSVLLKIIATFLGLSILGGSLYLMVRVGYDSSRQYVSSVEIVDEDVPSFSSRAPYRVAVESSNRNMSNITGNAQGTKSLPAESKTGQWNTIIERRGPWVGYESIQSISTPLYGSVKSDNVKFCSFDEKAAPLKVNGGLPHNDLTRILAWTVPFDVIYDNSDIYGYCDGDTPYVVFPLKQVVGFYAAYEVPYGVATYNGKTGDILIITDEKEISKIAGSTYPSSLAINQRDATTALGDLGDYLFGSIGFQTTINDGGDPNGENRSEFQLRDEKEDRASYVTPLTPRGDSTNIVALGITDASVKKLGKLNTYKVYEYGSGNSREANSTVESNIKSEYSNLTGWASGITVFEIVPAENNTWVASIGQDQSVIYRAVISKGGDIILYNKDGVAVSKVNSNGQSDSETEGNVNANDVNLGELTPKQLIDLSRQILNELESRQK